MQVQYFAPILVENWASRSGAKVENVKTLLTDAQTEKAIDNGQQVIKNSH